MGYSSGSVGGGQSGASSVAVSPLDVVPGSPHAKDDEFSGSALDGKWTNPITSAANQDLSLAVANGWLIFEPATAGTSGTSKTIFGIRQAAPTGSFTVSAKVGSGRITGAGSDSIYGIFVERLTATVKAHVLGIQHGSNRFVQAIGVTTPSHTADWSDWDGFESNITPEAYTTRWVRIGWDSGSSTLSFYYSGDGALWHRLTTRAAMAQPEHIGLCIYSRSALVNADNQLAVDWFRVTEP